ncbi:MAG: hypothetical protein ACQEXJ_19335, partial [Myxococcota bacterium]
PFQIHAPAQPLLQEAWDLSGSSGFDSGHVSFIGHVSRLGKTPNLGNTSWLTASGGAVPQEGGTLPAVPNLFIKTSHDLAEEGRLTNALMAVLQLSDRQVLLEFLRMATGDEVPLDEDEDVGFDLQVPFDTSRPDARIRTAHLDVVIESKVGPLLDHGQLRRHWVHLARQGHKRGSGVGSRLVDLHLDGVPRRSAQRTSTGSSHAGWIEKLGSFHPGFLGVVGAVPDFRERRSGSGARALAALC